MVEPPHRRFPRREEEEVSEPTPEQQKSYHRLGLLLIALWTVALIGVYTWVGSSALKIQQDARAHSIEGHADRMDPVKPESGATEADIPVPAGAVPVRAGIYVDRIVAMSLPDVSWTVDFYLWFSWTGNPELDPGATFQVVDGWIDSKELAEAYNEGEIHYQMYRVVATITKSFTVTRFPVDDHLLTINIETTDMERHAMVFVADKESSGTSSRVKVPGYVVEKAEGAPIIEKPHAYKTTRGDPRLKPGTKSVHSQLRYGIHLIREDWGYFWKMFQALYISVAISMLVFFIKPTDVDPRFGLGVGALFAAVANSYVSSSLIPQSGVSTLTDMINGLGAFTILLTVCQSTISLYIYSILEEEKMSRIFDWTSVFVFGIGYTAVNVMLPLAAALN